MAATIAPPLESPHLGEAVAPHYRTPMPQVRLADEVRHRWEPTAWRKGGGISSLDRPLVHPVHVDHREIRRRVDVVHRKETRSMDKRVLVHRERRSRP